VSAATSASTDPLSYPHARYAWYVVAVLALANTSAFIDRQILGLLVGPIRRDLGITDSQMGVLYGLAFAVLYTLLGIPIGRAADRGNRRAIIAIGIAAWSVMTVLCGLARNYNELLLARFGVAIGEAALAAPALSIIGDYFNPTRRATALSVYALGIFLGAGLANVVGGIVLARLEGSAAVAWPLLGEIRAWQQVFVIVGLPGLLVALLMLTVREPIRHETGQRDVSSGYALPVVAGYLAANRRTFLCHNLGFALFALVNFATAAWMPTNLVRTYGWTAARAGITLGMLTTTIGVLGVVTGGRVADAMLARGYTDAKVRVGIIAALANLVGGIVIFALSPSATVTIAAMVPYNFFAAFSFGAAIAALQDITPNRMRAQVGALFVSATTLIGLGFGPTIVGVFTATVFGIDAAVRTSLLIVTTVGLAATAALLAAGLPAYRRSVVYRREWTGALSASETR
jgi:MFS family permease